MEKYFKEIKDFVSYFSEDTLYFIYLVLQGDIEVKFNFNCNLPYDDNIISFVDLDYNITDGLFIESLKENNIHNVAISIRKDADPNVSSFLKNNKINNILNFKRRYARIMFLIFHLYTFSADELRKLGENIAEYLTDNSNFRERGYSLYDKTTAYQVIFRFCAINKESSIYINNATKPFLNACKYENISIFDTNREIPYSWFIKSLKGSEPYDLLICQHYEIASFLPKFENRYKKLCVIIDDFTEFNELKETIRNLFEKIKYIKAIINLDNFILIISDYGYSEESIETFNVINRDYDDYNRMDRNTGNIDKVYNDVTSNKIILSKKKLEEADFNLSDIDFSMDEEYEFCKIKLSDILTPIIKKKGEESCDTLIIKKFSKDNYVIDPVKCAHKTLSALPASYGVISEDALLIDFNHYSPVYFNYKGISYNTNAYAFSIDDDMLVDYVFYQLKQPYFKKQLFKNGDIFSRVNINSFLQSYIIVPQGDTSYEKQYQIIEKLKYGHIIYEYNKQNLNIEKLCKSENIYLGFGTILYNKYEIISPINEGGFGKIYKAIDISNEQTVIIKELFVKDKHTRDVETQRLLVRSPFEYLEIEKSKKSFYNEFKFNKMLSSVEGIIETSDIFEENSTVYYVMKYIEGSDLYNYIGNRGIDCLSEEEAISITLKICNIVDKIHSLHLNHLDIKPENIIIENSTSNVYLIDFGNMDDFSSYNSEKRVTSQGYSPKELADLRSFTPQSDIYSIAATLYNMLTGFDVPRAELLENNFELLERTENISNKTWNAITMSMQTDINIRPCSIKEFIELIK